MTIMNSARRIAVALAVALVPANALAVAVGYVDASRLNIRIGPGTGYEAFDNLRRGDRVTIYGHTRDGYWCDISAEDLRGWAACDYIHIEADLIGPVRSNVRVDVPVVVFTFDDYHDRHYRHRPWYRDRHWRHRGRRHWR